MKKLCTFLSIIFLCHFSFAATYYVSTTGNDTSGDGSSAKPWRTLQYAVTKVSANLGHTIQLASGTFIENGLINIPPGVNIAGAGKTLTILKSASSFYYHPASPGYSVSKFLISLSSGVPSNGNQTLSNFTIDGDSKQLHGGVYVHNRNNVTIDAIKVQNTNFTGIWLWNVNDSKLKNTDLINCSWGNTSYCSGALNLGNLARVDIDNISVDESTGYGIKAIGPSGVNTIDNVKIHDSRISVNPTGLWNSGSAPNIAIELWSVNLIGSEIYNTYVDNTISLINNNDLPSTGIQTIRVHHNTIDIDTRAKGAGYGMELTIHDAEVDHNYFIKGTYGIANWDKAMKNWSIHHNTFYALQGQYPGEVLRSQSSGLHNVKLYNNTVEFASNKTMNVVGIYGGASDNVSIENNLFINNNTAYSYYPNSLIHMENGATLSVLVVRNNLFNKLPVGNISGGTYQNNLTSDPMIAKTGNRPNPYYMPLAGSPLIDAGLTIIHVGLIFSGAAPDIGAIEFVDPGTNSLPQVSLTSPAGGASFPQDTSVTISANASDSDGIISKVGFYNGSALLGEDTSSPYNFTWNNVPAGAFLLTAKAMDNVGATTSSSIISIIVTSPNAPPTISLTSPSDNSTFTAGNSITLTATASDSDGTISKVEFYNGTTVLGQITSSPFSFTWNNVPEGVFILTAKATDNVGATTSSSIASIIIVAPNVLPTVSLTSPSNNSIFTTGNSIVLTATASDSDGVISKVEFYNDSTFLGQDILSPYSLLWSPPPGNYKISAKAIDNSGASVMSGYASVLVNTTVVTSSSLSVYPNPILTNQFTIQYNTSVAQQAQISIFSLGSKLIRQFMVNLIAGSNNILVSTSGIYNGTYIISLAPAITPKLTTRVLIRN